MGHHGILAPGPIATGTAQKVLLKVVAGANHPIEISEALVSFEGQVNTDKPIHVELYRLTTSGTSTSMTPKQAQDFRSDSFATVGGKTFTADPDLGDLVRDMYIHPQSGLIYQLADNAPISVKAAGELAIVVTAAVDVNVIPQINFIE